VPIAGVPDEVSRATQMVAGFILADVPFDVPALGWVFLEVGHLLEEGADFGEGRAAWY
jgi:hypothetical protein